MKAKKIIATLALGLIISTIITTYPVQAALQNVPTKSSREATATDWILSIRKMEEENGGMALKETVGTDALATTDSNNIDVHMLKNTEYGAIVLLGASDYGKQGAVGGTGRDRWMNTGGTATSGTSTTLATTTGNVTGIYELGYKNMSLSATFPYECVAGGLNSFLPNIASRYMNRYTESEDSALLGDATVETKYWHSSRESFHWLTSSHITFTRGATSASNGIIVGAFNTEMNSINTSRGARASVVCGTGF